MEQVLREYLRKRRQLKRDLGGKPEPDDRQFITKEESRQFSEAHPEWPKWSHIPANVKESMLARINSRLVAEGIPAVEMVVLKWRMSQLLRDILRKYGT